MLEGDGLIPVQHKPCDISIAVQLKAIFPIVQEDLSMPLIEEEIDGLSGLLFPFYDADTHMLYLAGKVCVLGAGMAMQGAGAANTRTNPLQDGARGR